MMGDVSTPSISCKRKLNYTCIWDKIDLLCTNDASVRHSFEIVFGDSLKSESYGSKAHDEFDEDMNSLINKLEKVCRLLKDDQSSQRSVTEILYESSVAVHNESIGDISQLPDTSLNCSFDAINTSRSNLDISLNDSILIEQRMNPAKRRRISFNTECSARPISTPDEKKPNIRFQTPEPYTRTNSTHDQHMSIAKMALSEARKDGHRVTSLVDFTIIKPISRGAYGKVYLAKRKKTGDYFAIKIMRKDNVIQKNMVDQVMTERDALALAKSPFIVKLFYSFQSKQEVYFVMEYIIGGDLCSFLSYVGCLEEEHAVLYMAEVALALTYIHQHNIIHKDIKLENILIDKYGHIKLTDFGLSSIRLARKLTISDLVNSPNNFSPSTHWRTPGQLFSLTANLAFRSPGTPTVLVKVSDSGIRREEDTTPITRRKKFIPKRCSFGGSNSLSASNLSASSAPPLSTYKSPISTTHTSDILRYSDEEVSFGEPSKTPEESPSDAAMSDHSIPADPQVSKIIGTPDYIAPELLFHRPHTCAADWWSFGICLYELVVGIPPFHDNNITDIFKNILNMEIEWPAETSEDAKEIIYELLQFEPSRRASFGEIKCHKFFKAISWDNILQAEMPFVPNPENETDTGYFEGHNEAFNIKLSDFNGCISEED